MRARLFVLSFSVLLEMSIVCGPAPAADLPVPRAQPVNPAPPGWLSPEATIPRAAPAVSAGADAGQPEEFVNYPVSAPETVASSALMVDARSGAILFAKNPDVQRPVASTQKLLTALLVVAHGDLDARVRVSSEDCRVEPTKLGFRSGEIYTKRQLLAAMLVHSCNDVAICLARNDAGSVAAFAQRMNAKAAALGATQSHFVNPNGLPVPGQYSTARDMARIALAAYHNPILREYMKLPGLSFTYNSGRTRFLEATNKLVARSPMFTGMKTGYSGPSGRCLISSASNGGREVILVQLGGTHRVLFDDAQRLLIWGLDRGGVSANSTVARGSGTLN
jgi:D-alanyl-D-alanine carboxypeptidase (penicillin-binding protein 5/6)